MYSNKPTSTLFAEICDSFFRGSQEYYIQYFDNKGAPKLAAYDCHVVPTYMVYSRVGEVVIADTKVRSLHASENDNSCNHIDIIFQDPKRIRKIGVLFRSDYTEHFHVRWIAIEKDGTVESFHQNRDLHKDLSLIARRFGVKPNKVRVA